MGDWTDYAGAEVDESEMLAWLDENYSDPAERWEDAIPAELLDGPSPVTACRCPMHTYGSAECYCFCTEH